MKTYSSREAEFGDQVHPHFFASYFSDVTIGPCSDARKNPAIYRA
jgi:hypothetical protein